MNWQVSMEKQNGRCFFDTLGSFAQDFVCLMMEHFNTRDLMRLLSTCKSFYKLKAVAHVHCSESVLCDIFNNNKRLKRRADNAQIAPDMMKLLSMKIVAQCRKCTYWMVLPNEGENEKCINYCPPCKKIKISGKVETEKRTDELYEKHFKEREIPYFRSFCYIGKCKVCGTLWNEITTRSISDGGRIPDFCPQCRLKCSQ